MKRKGISFSLSGPSKRTRTGGLHTGSNDAFPHFSKGTVGIYLSPDPKHQYRLHKAVLERNSSWFSRSFKAWEDMTLEDKAISTRGNRLDGIKYCFFLERLEGKGDLRLIRKVLMLLWSGALHKLIRRLLTAMCRTVARGSHNDYKCTTICLLFG